MTFTKVIYFMRELLMNQGFVALTFTRVCVASYTYGKT